METATLPTTPAQAKLGALQDRFNGFERQMESETKQRRDTDENKVSMVRDSMTKLEKTLNSEIKRRVEANKALQAMFESQIATVQDKLEAVFCERLDQLQSSVDSLNDRMSLVERDFTMEREKYVRNIEKKRDGGKRSQRVAKCFRERKSLAAGARSQYCEADR
eukprot:GEMP01045058.1.p1 GENE.GEMP01045058.1~~GEMP01045058.1.p1  ORF type:complete len:164 (+),score=40.46 GEMP01045058.1:235-726(+)